MANIVYIETYGCSANQNNSEILAGLLTRAGYLITNNENLADIIILNTCIVKSKTETKIKRRIQDLSQFSKNKTLIIAGCMPMTEEKAIKKICPHSLLLGTHNIKDILTLIERKKNIIDIKNEEKINLPKIPANKLISIHQISEGCLGNCTYCKTKLAKGRLFSYPQEKIMKSIESDLEQGAKEIWLTSQDNASYGLDTIKHGDYSKENYKLPELLKNIINLRHNFKIRLGMMNPDKVKPIIENLIELYKSQKLYKFLHIPIQSASNQILAHMKREYKIEEAERIIERFRKNFPDITIATDIIVGYPAETEQDHQKNLEFIKKFRPSILNLSKFSFHKQTEAGKLKPLSNKIIKNRTTELMILHRKTAKENKEKFLNREIKVFVNKRIGENTYESRDENYNLILIKGDKSLLGKNVGAVIEEIGAHHMMSKVE